MLTSPRAPAAGVAGLPGTCRGHGRHRQYPGPSGRHRLAHGHPLWASLSLWTPATCITGPPGTHGRRRQSPGQPQHSSPGPQAPTARVTLHPGAFSGHRQAPRHPQRVSSVPWRLWWASPGPLSTMVGITRPLGILNPTEPSGGRHCNHLHPRQTSTCSTPQRRVSPVSWAPATGVSCLWHD